MKRKTVDDRVRQGDNSLNLVQIESGAISINLFDAHDMSVHSGKYCAKEASGEI